MMAGGVEGKGEAVGNDSGSKPVSGEVGRAWARVAGGQARQPMPQNLRVGGRTTPAILHQNLGVPGGGNGGGEGQVREGLRLGTKLGPAGSCGLDCKGFQGEGQAPKRG